MYHSTLLTIHFFLSSFFNSLMEMNPPKPHAILLASPGMGHLKPMLQLGHRLVRLHDLQITLFIITNETNTSSASKSHLFTSNSDLFHIHLITPPPQDLTSQPDSGIIRNLVMTMRACIPRIRSAISEMKLAPTALVVDLFGTDFWDLADEFGMLKFGFMTTNALFLAAFISVPFLVNKLSRKEYEALERIEIPGCKSVAYEDVFELANRDDPDHIFARSMATNFINADGVLINTWYDLEPNTIKLLKDGRLLGRVYPIGPITEQIDKVSSESSDDNRMILHWLDKQPKESVIYASFGSGRSLTYQQIQELALGLESSKQRFIWVLRPPTDEVTEYFFSARNQDEALDYLPDGFLARTKDVGLVVPMWAPQAEILAHSSVGGFLTHCGWNSTLESITNGVPMIAWPLYGDQNLISIMLTDELKVAIRPSVRPSKAVVGREEVKELVLKLMDVGEGNIMRNRAKEIQCTADKVLHAQKTGSAMDSLHHFATRLHYKRSGQKRQSKLLRCITCCVTRH